MPELGVDIFKLEFRDFDAASLHALAVGEKASDDAGSPKGAELDDLILRIERRT